jgi:hypothetical protein
LNVRRREFYAGGLCAGLGLATAAGAWRYPLGTMRDIGPGLYPLALGLLLAGVGLLVGIGALLGATEEEEVLAHGPEWVGWVCIIAGVGLFIILVRPAGLVVAAFISTLVWALGDRETSWRGAATLAACIAVFGAVLFGVLLGVTLPLWPVWP